VAVDLTIIEVERREGERIFFETKITGHIGIDVHVVAPPAPTDTLTQIKLTPGTPGPNGKEPPAMSDFVLQDDQEVVVTITGADAAGNPVAVTFDAGSVTAVSAVPTVLEPTVSADQSSVTIAAVGPEETGVVVTVTGTVGGVSYSGSITIDVTASPLTSIGLSPGTPTTLAAASNPAPAPAASTETPTVEAPVNVTAPAAPVDTTNPTPPAS
jgi:hypothetical protein